MEQHLTVNLSSRGRQHASWVCINSVTINLWGTLIVAWEVGRLSDFCWYFLFKKKIMQTWHYNFILIFWPILKRFHEHCHTFSRRRPLWTNNQIVCQCWKKVKIGLFDSNLFIFTWNDNVSFEQDYIRAIN